MARWDLGLTVQNFKWVAAQLSPSVDPEMVMAVSQVECKREPFYPDGFPAILFERHVFWRNAPKDKREEWHKAYPHICSKTATPKGGYGSYAAQRTKFNTAFNLDKDAAMKACSWGAFQELGENYKDYGFKSVGKFVDQMKNGLFGQADIFIKSIKKRRLVQAFVDKNYAVIAKSYNGVGYRKFKYDEQIRDAYFSFKQHQIEWDSILASAPSIFFDSTSSAAASDSGKPETVTETESSGNFANLPPVDNGSISNEPPPEISGPNEPLPADKVVVEKEERVEVKEGFFKKLWMKIVGGATALGGVDAITDKAQQAQALGLPASFWTRMFYVLVAIAVAWLIYELWVEVIHPAIVNWRKRRRTAELIAANSTPNGVLMLAKADELDKYEAAGWTVIRRG